MDCSELPENSGLFSVSAVVISTSNIVRMKKFSDYKIWDCVHVVRTTFPGFKFILKLIKKYF